MLRNFRWSGLVIFGLLTFLTPEAGAHPQLVGRWTSPEPAGGSTSYFFEPGIYVGNGVWTGCLTLNVSGFPVSKGFYELRMWSGNEGSIGIRDGTCISTSVGSIDLGARTMTYKMSTYRP